MTLKKFFAYFVIQYLLLAVAKAVFFGPLTYNGSVSGFLIYAVALAVLSAAVVRRFGVINFLEAGFAALSWILGDLALDAIFTRNFTGPALFRGYYYWLGLVVMIIAILSAHKKRHVKIRKEHQAAHDGQHH